MSYFFPGRDDGAKPSSNFEPMYMNGRGTMKRAHELGDAMWDALLPAIFGTSFAFIGPLFAWALILPWPEPATGFQITFALFVSVVCFGAGIAASLPWWRANREIKDYTAKMKAETDKRGPGWAQS